VAGAFGGDGVYILFNASTPSVDLRTTSGNGLSPIGGGTLLQLVQGNSTSFLLTTSKRHTNVHCVYSRSTAVTNCVKHCGYNVTKSVELNA